MDEINRMEKENARLKEVLMCKTCIDNLADVVLLPCGHNVCCGQCAVAFTECPVCQKTVIGRMKVFFATSTH